MLWTRVFLSILIKTNNVSVRFRCLRVVKTAGDRQSIVTDDRKQSITPFRFWTTISNRFVHIVEYNARFDPFSIYKERNRRLGVKSRER